MNRYQRIRPIGLFQVLLILILVFASKGQSIDAQINLQEKEYKEVDLTDYFGLIIDSFYIQNQPNGIKVVNAVEILSKSISSPTFEEREVLDTLKTSNTDAMQVSAKLINSGEVILKIVFDNITESKREISITNVMLGMIGSNGQVLSDLNVEAILLTQNYCVLLISSIEQTILSKILVSNKMIQISSITGLQPLLNIKYMRIYPISTTQYFLIAIQNNCLVIYLNNNNDQLAQLQSILYPCGNETKSFNFIKNEAFYLLQCTQNNGQVQFKAYQLAFQTAYLVSVLSASSLPLEYTLPSSANPKQTISAINSELVYILEVSCNTSVNTMILHKVKYSIIANQIDVSSVLFETVVSDTEILSSFIISQDLIALITKDYILGFSVKKSKLIYRIKQQELPDKILINTRQIFKTLLFTYEMNNASLQEDEQVQDTNEIKCESSIEREYQQINKSEQVRQLEIKEQSARPQIQQQLQQSANTRTVTQREVQTNLLEQTSTKVYKTYEFGLNIPYLIIDLSQAQTSPIKFSVREQQNPFNQIVNFQTNILPRDSITVSINQDKINVYKVIENSSDQLQFVNIEKYITGSDLHLELNDFQSDNLKIQSLIKGMQIVPSIDTSGIPDIDKVIGVNKNYLGNLIVITQLDKYNKQIKAVKLETNEDGTEVKALVLNNLIDVRDPAMIQFDSNGVLYTQNEGVMNILFPIQTQQSEVKLITICTNLLDSYSTIQASDPIHNVIMYTDTKQVQIISFQIDPTSNKSPFIDQKAKQFDNQITGIYINSLLSIAYITDNVSIFAYNYVSNYDLTTIKIPDSTQVVAAETLRNIYLFSHTFIVVRIYSNGESEANIYSYDNFNYPQPKYLRQLLGLTYKLMLEDINSIFTYQSYSGEQEYIVIPALNSQQQKINLLFRLNDVSSQNQLYVSFPSTQGAANILPFYMNNFIGCFSQSTSTFTLYSFSYSISLNIGYTIPNEAYLQNYSFKASSSILILNSSTNLNANTKHILDPKTNHIIADDQKISLNLELQKNVESNYGSINQGSSGVVKLLNYFNSQQLKAGDIIGFDDTGSYNGNILGWKIAYSPSKLQLQIFTQNRLGISYVGGLNAYDIIRVGSLIATTYNNRIIFNDGQFIQLPQSLDYCYILLDESSVIEACDLKTKKITEIMTIYTLCQSTEVATTEVLTQITLKQTPQLYNNPPLIEVTSMASFTSVDNTFDRTKLTIINISNDPNLGFIATVQQQGQVSPQICQIVLSGDNDNKTFTFDFQVLDTLKYLRIVYVMWNNLSNSNIFFTSDGLAYYAITPTFDQFEVINIKQIMLDANNNINVNSQVIGVHFLLTLDRSTTVLIGFDSGALYSLNLVFDELNKFQSLTSLQYFTEPGYVFTGFAASVFTNQSETIIAMYDQYKSDEIIFFYYQPDQEPNVIRSSATTTIQNYLAFNGQIKIFFIESKCYYFMNRKDDQLGTVGRLLYSQNANIIISSFTNNINYDSIGFYMTPIDVTSTKQTTLPVQVKIITQIQTSSYLLSYSLSIGLIVILFIC